MSTLLRFLLCCGVLLQVAVADAGIFGSGSGTGKVAWLTDMKKAGQESQRTGKPILLQLTAPWCSYCHKMLKETFTDAAIAKRVNESFVPLLLDADENEQVVEMLKITSFPSTIIISADFDELGRISGFQKADAFGKKLSEFAPAGRARVAQTSNTEEKTIVAPAASVTPPARNVVPNSEANAVPTTALPTSVPTPMTQVLPSTNSNAVEETPRLPLPLPDFPISAPSVATSTPKSELPSLEQIKTEAEQPALRAPAFEGMCLVSMLEEREPIKGVSEFAAVYRGQRLNFRNSDQLAKFKADPEKYWPWFDGRCPVATRRQSEQTMGRPQTGGAYRQRLIFFRDDAHRAEFAKNPRAYFVSATSEQPSKSE